MKHIRIVRSSLILILIIGFGTGCAGNLNNNHITKVHVTKPINQSVANEAKEKVIRKDEISGVKAVNTDKELLLAIKVDNFDRFRLKKIEKNVKTELEKVNPDYKVFISGDSKIYLEIQKLEQKLDKNKEQMKTLKKEISEIKSLMKEQT
ncbi:hypothetical protein CVD28_07890 [Bacillus sp. M6-12]|uniref:YhcN/YlaJ family sporulation lipoprotein n=1 Tax=Bacillus sp. M6-12 TaxID=2054166 RepID=UPI000C779F6F|nr:YhcN/YlaJ family sporulation lipoprotein [Bacillus sp. M6-12]PLS18202.1 hypothetical protein CVD28_07890 [Bacillus sp. M6-12]